MKVILCCLVLFILLACPVTALIAPIQNATKVMVRTPTPHITLIEQNVVTIITTPTETPTQPLYWYFTITSNPSGAEIFNNGEPTYEITPYIETHLKSGLLSLRPWNIILKYPGYEDYIFEPFTLTGANITRHADMVPLPVTTQPVPDQVTVVQPSGTIPPDQVPTTLSTQGQAAVTGTPASIIGSSGSLSITTTPSGAEIFIDNEFKGVSPAIIAGLSAGTHALGIAKEGYRNISTTISIEPGQAREYSTGLIETTTASTTTSSKAPGFSALPAVLILSVLLIIGKRMQ